MHMKKPMSLEPKNRITVTLDVDVLEKLLDIAKTHRLSISALVNRVLAEKLGIIPKDVIWGEKK